MLNIQDFTIMLIFFASAANADDIVASTGMNNMEAGNIKKS